MPIQKRLEPSIEGEPVLDSLITVGFELAEEGLFHFGYEDNYEVTGAVTYLDRMDGRPFGEAFDAQNFTVNLWRNYFKQLDANHAVRLISTVAIHETVHCLRFKDAPADLYNGREDTAHEIIAYGVELAFVGDFFPRYLSDHCLRGAPEGHLEIANVLINGGKLSGVVGLPTDLIISGDF